MLHRSMTTAKILERPDRFDRVDRVKAAAGQPILPGDDRFWILGDPLVVLVEDGAGPGERVVVPPGFTTDGASVPGWATRLTRWTRWDPPQRWGGIVHDWRYGERGCAKARADLVFRAVLTAEGAGPVKASAMYLAVVVGGGPAYRRNQARGPWIFR